TASRLTVADTGPGIATAISDRLFTPFTSTKPTGTGLGLSISRRIVRDHGGTLTGENRAEGGAGFNILLPQGSGVSSQQSKTKQVIQSQGLRPLGLSSLTPDP